MERNKLRVVHYVNQFFGGLGGEEKADTPVFFKEGPIGPGLTIKKLFGDIVEVVGTIVCGDNYFTEQNESTKRQVIKMVREAGVDGVIAGPAFNAGRFGMACGEVCKIVQDELSLPAVCAMFEENPGVDVFHEDVIIVQSSDSVRKMPDALKKMVRILIRLVEGEKIGRPSEEGYFTRGIIKNEKVEKNGASRAADMVLAKIGGVDVQPELELPKFDKIHPANLTKSLSTITLALATDGGIVPLGNPDNMESNRSHRFAQYSIKNMDALTPDKFEANHMGFDTEKVNQDPNRLVPVDAVRELEKENYIGKLYDEVFTTAGVATSLKNAKQIADEMATAMKNRGIDAVILTST